MHRCLPRQPIPHLLLQLFMFPQLLAYIKVFPLGKVNHLISECLEEVHLDHQWLLYVIQCVVKFYHVHFMVGLPIVVI